MKTRLCAYFKSRRKDDWCILAVLYLLLAQLLLGTFTVYAQSNYRPGQFSSRDGKFSTAANAPQSFEVGLALTDAQVERDGADIAALRVQIAALVATSLAQGERLIALEHFNEVATKILNLTYGVIGTIAGGLVLAIINMRLQRNGRRDQVSKDDIREIIAEQLKGYES